MYPSGWDINHYSFMYISDERKIYRDKIQFFLLKLTDIIKYIRPEDQTLSVYGFSENEISALLSSLINRGIDRVVPIGQALEFNNIWDGVDLLETMSRKIDISKLKRK